LLAWITRWAYWQVSGVSRQLTGHEQGVRAVAFGEVDGRPVIVSGSEDGSVRVWDARSGQPHREPHAGHTWAVSAVAQGKIEGRPVIVSSSGNLFLGKDNTVRVWDAQSGQPRGEWVTGHTGAGLYGDFGGDRRPAGDRLR
jgi:WD40 repeat protein